MFHDIFLRKRGLISFLLVGVTLFFVFSSLWSSEVVSAESVTTIVVQKPVEEHGSVLSAARTEARAPETDTNLQFCSTPDLGIPDNNAAGVVDTIVVPEGGSILDLNVAITATHTWVGDLIFTLEHAETGTAVTLIDRIGIPATSYGCYLNNIYATLDDEALVWVENACPPTGGNYIPNSPLSSFDGEDLSGTWNIHVSDHVRGDAGRLAAWCLDAAAGTAPTISVEPTALSSVQPADVQLTSTLTITNSGDHDLTWFVEEAQAAASMPLPSPVQGAGTAVTPNGTTATLSHSTNFKMPLITNQTAAPDTMQLLVNDGSFENDPSDWNLASSNACYWIGNWHGVWGVPAYDGSMDYWGGGYCISDGVYYPNSSIVTQTVTIPTNTQYLGLKYLAYRPDDDDAVINDYAFAAINSSLVWSLDSTQANNTFPNWETERVDISAFAGQTITLTLGFISNVDGTADYTGNIRFDYIHLLDETTCDFPGDISWYSVSPNSGQIDPHNNSIVDIIFDSTGMDDGTYSSTLCVNSNDPANPVLQIPVTLTVEDAICVAPEPISHLAIAQNNGHAALNWDSVDGADFYEVWWGADDPYFTPGDDCSAAANCATTSNPHYIHQEGGLGDPQHNFTYVVRSVSDCGSAYGYSSISNRAAEFDFSIQPGS
ncbi:MAG: proprotein convertase P-domain-containing protein [Ardenticatenaceae bacterium]|nr:proprotein convertase P-domain-containing protein [Anaerolineales bacterium]MCB8920616.1 proprotein convertase P-domain-containing protein [Ardenticatenaceae bacterium]MCB8990240.1 proprotein convertase P-domain-containing protein [Ardenticatenaceae bacterium]MCB9002968.1 proprotein convertase P-domain-containing protein [Ardenticatenaceae bacterium]